MASATRGATICESKEERRKNEDFVLRGLLGSRRFILLSPVPSWLFSTAAAVVSLSLRSDTLTAPTLRLKCKQVMSSDEAYVFTTSSATKQSSIGVGGVREMGMTCFSFSARD